MGDWLLQAGPGGAGEVEDPDEGRDLCSCESNAEGDGAAPECEGHAGPWEIGYFGETSGRSPVETITWGGFLCLGRRDRGRRPRRARRRERTRQMARPSASACWRVGPARPAVGPTVGSSSRSSC